MVCQKQRLASLSWRGGGGARGGVRGASASKRVLRTRAGGLSFKKFGKILEEKAKADWNRVFEGTEKTRERLGVVDELLCYWNLDDSEDTLEELEDALIASDFGPGAALTLVDSLRDRIREGEIKDQGGLKKELKKNMVGILESASINSGSGELAMSGKGLSVILIVGVNGGGKTTTVGKLSNRFAKEGYKVTLAAGDTFRAAAKEQLEVWAERTGATVADYPADMEKPNPIEVLKHAAEQSVEAESDSSLLICDTSGRIHNNFKLMDEIEKCKKVLSEVKDGAPNETLLVLDSTTGLNMLNQAREFNDYIGITGLVLTKLDGTARGGAVIGVVQELGIPIKFIGVGETVDDLQPFNAEAFVDGILSS
ncbi:cell division transporter substrate-binding protein FtsY [Chloropicon primus]|uniref:Cell division transporter substrate-binding protein FtsY n=1 Tax=Chloropicon primus TaxID=1764295 RepID=A0A5B8MSV3_9CHLO|nr:cell division transporter substrate-binding protein FtsY [Chloropicon primus]UPR02579.1 cell division transporter substrate-binding protein FtsY [Chloropicon primus]|eukprot:QDZ23367.1 cell division transporter substrate-binding protein FtsY [Chloropicon primus]